MNKYVDPEDSDKEDQVEIMPVMFYSLYTHAINVAEHLNDLKKVSDIFELGITKCKDYKTDFRQNYNYIMTNFALNDMERVRKSLDNAKEQFEDHLMLKVCKERKLKSIIQINLKFLHYFCSFLKDCY